MSENLSKKIKLDININDYLADYKIISDVIHGTITISKLAMIIIDTNVFQRLRYLKQLSTCYFVFPSAIHTRFEHSIGTYHIAKKMLNTLKTKSINSELDVISEIPELQNYFKENNITSNYLTQFIIELVCIGALCHDLGHGAYSHLFDDYFLQKTNISDDKKRYMHHEYRSCMLLKYIVDNNNILKEIITEDLLNFIFNIINPSNKHKEYIYQIVSNNLNSIDVDKFDYLTRDSKMLNINISFNYNRLVENAMVINNIICYPKKIDVDIVNLFTTRHYLHKKVYSHKGVISSLLLINKLLIHMNQYLDFINNINDCNKFILLTDDYILNIARFYSQKDNELKKIIDKIDNHDLYQMIYCAYIDINDTLSENILNLIKYDNNILYYENVIGFISGKKNNPLESVWLYKTKNPYTNLENLIQSDSNKLLPQKYQEKLIILFYNKKITNDELENLLSKINL